MTTTRVALLALAALLALPGASLARRPKTKTETVKVAGLDRPAKVLRDTFGVPHVFAKSEHDGYFMVGYLHAQDRLFQMDSAAGRRAAPSRSCLGRARSRVTSLCGRSGCIGRRFARWPQSRLRAARSSRRTRTASMLGWRLTLFLPSTPRSS
jgi:hypothetical protein